jgi:hypothetical protein
VRLPKRGNVDPRVFVRLRHEQRFDARDRDLVQQRLFVEWRVVDPRDLQHFVLPELVVVRYSDLQHFVLAELVVEQLVVQHRHPRPGPVDHRLCGHDVR